MTPSLADVKITNISTMLRTDDAQHLVVQITYTSSNGSGVYGFEYRKDASGNNELLRQGEDVTIDNLVK